MLQSTERRNTFFRSYWLLILYLLSIIYLELVYRLWSFGSLNIDFLYPMIFSVTASVILALLSSIATEKVNQILAFVLMILLVIGYGVQLFYFCIFHTPLSLFSLVGAEDAMKFTDIVFSVLIKNLGALLLLLVPLLVLGFASFRLEFKQIRRSMLYKLLLVVITGYTVSIICVNLNQNIPLSPKDLYYSVSAPELSVRKLGLLTTVRLDFERLIFGFEPKELEEASKNTSSGANSEALTTTGAAINTDTEVDTVVPPASTGSPDSANPTSAASRTDKLNIINIDFKSLISREKNKQLLDMHQYFSTVTPTNKNRYTGMFEGNNLILITAESFSPYVISKELTPTLYKMSTEGFVFKNFYNPVWGVSTSDGEYVACTGLIPKAGVWSFAKSGANFMPFAMGNQFRVLGYTTKAFHDHTYTYYKRDISHPNMGYDYRGVGNGLMLKKTWPESDVEMINVTADQYLNKQPFHIYYMTVSGHMNYSFTGNYMSYKNRSYVAMLPYSDPSKAYLAANLEFEFAMKTLLNKLEAAGALDNTVIAISPDHYPYGLPRECIDELAGHKVENNFELYKSSLLLWKKGMTPIVVNKPCTSLDIIPTLSNLFGLRYDSRLLMGRDILSDAASLVIFSNRSWITDKGSYNSLTNAALDRNGLPLESSYVNRINKLVNNKFRFSAKILETDYYKRVIPDLFKTTK